MTKEQIENEIRRLNKKIEASRQNISAYKKSIKECEDAYNDSGQLTTAFQNSLANYNNSVNSALKRLDKDSIFGNYYKSKITPILNGKESRNISELINQGKRNCLNLIDKYEEKISNENAKINSYKLQIKKLESEMAAAV